MTECHNPGLRIRGDYWPPQIEAGYVTQTKEADQCVETVNGLRVGLGTNFVEKLRGVVLGIYNRAGDVDGVVLGAMNKGENLRGIIVGLFKNEFTQSMTGAGLAIVQSAKQMYGVFASIAFNATGEDMVGFMPAALNIAGRDMRGFQLGLFANTADRDMTGVQASALINDADGNLYGFQLAEINKGNEIKHFSVGFVNQSESCNRMTPLFGFSCPKKT